MNEKEKLSFCLDIYNEYLDRKNKAIKGGTHEANINSFDIYLKRWIEKQELIEQWRQMI